MGQLLDFPCFEEILERLDNHALFLMPNGIYKVRELIPDNYLFPMYCFQDGDYNLVSTSVFALIRHLGNFERNPRFQTTRFFRPSFRTLDSRIMRARTLHRRSSRELCRPEQITELGASLIQDYISEIEDRFPGWVHVLLTGGKDSQNILLCRRRERWIVLSGAPNDVLNEAFIDQNGLLVEDFIHGPSNTDDRYLLEEILASDCSFDIAHFRWVPQIKELVERYDGKIVLWMGTSGDGCFSRNNNHRDIDYYAVHDLHVGTAMGVLHQLYKNLFNIPVLSPYQSPRFLSELFYRYDPYFVDHSGDVRVRLGEILFGRPVWYPPSNPTPPLLARKRDTAIPIYVGYLKRHGVACREHRLSSFAVRIKEEASLVLDKHSAKRRTRLSRILFPLRQLVGKIFPALRNTRHDIAAREIR